MTDALSGRRPPRPSRAPRTTDTGACGTDLGYRRHRARGATPCDPCHAAHIDANRAWRAANPGHGRREYLRRKASRRAQADLAEMHPAQYQVLYAAHLRDIESQEDTP